MAQLNAKKKAASPFGPERLYLPALSEPKDNNEAERLLGVTITTRNCDREGDIVEPSGLDFTNYLKNPVVLWAHDLSAAPIGRVRSIRVTNDRVDATVQFADTKTAKEIYKLYAERYLNAWSIGFIPQEWQPLEPGEITPSLSANKAKDQKGFHITAAEVVELSAVPVPANPEALTRAIKSGKISVSKRTIKALELSVHFSSPENQDECNQTHCHTDEIIKSPGLEPERIQSPSDAAPESQGKTAMTWRYDILPLEKTVDKVKELARHLMRRELTRAIAAAKGELM